MFVEADLCDLIERHIGDRRAEALQMMDSADYKRLLALIKQELNHWVCEFELAGMTCELAGDRVRSAEPQLAAAWYERAQTAYENGMAYATGSGEGWHFRTLYDRVSGKLRRLLSSQ